jgi:hypothetical protein
MTGRYRITTPVGATAETRNRRWHTVVQVCRSLYRDGLSYDVQFHLGGNNPHVLISASGTPVPRKQPTAAHRVALPPPVRSAQCRSRVLELEWFLPENLGRRNNSTTYWRTHQSRYRELNQMAEDFLRAELEYWRELELLSGQRQHFKPGRTAETANADDEVAA